MPITLRIHLTGLILFVPDASPPGADRRPRLHAVLLKHGHHRSGHYPRLVYDQGHENHSSSRASHLCCKKLDNQLLQFEHLGRPIDPQKGFGSPSAPGKLPKEVAELDEISRVGRLKRQFVEVNPPPAEVAARVRIYEGQFESCLPGALWTVESPTNPKAWPRRITTLVTWVIPGIKDTSITLPLRGLGDESIKESVTLYPIDGVIELWIYNATVDDLPPQKDKRPKKGDPAEHFEVYYPPFGVGCKDYPILAETPTIPPRNPTPSDCKPPRQDRSDSAFTILAPLTSDTPTCLTAQAEME